MNVIHLAIYKTDDYSLLIEYELLDGGAIDIQSVDLQARPVSHFEQRERDRRGRRATQRLYNELDHPEIHAPY